MATTTRKEAMLAKLEYIVDTETLRKHHIFPMKIREMGTVEDLCSRINLEYTVLNMPHQATDSEGNLIFTENNVPVIDDDAWIAQCQLLEMALRDTWENIEQWIDIKDIQDILDAYQGLSGLKKKIVAMETKVQTGEAL